MLFALCKIKFFVTLYKKNLLMSKKSSIFASDLKNKQKRKHIIATE